jgi:hypothetical protein
MGETVLGPDHPNFALMLNSLALLLAAKEDNAEAESLWRRAIAIQEIARTP